MDIQQASKLALENGGSIVILIDNVPYRITISTLESVRKIARRGRKPKVAVPEPAVKKPRGSLEALALLLGGFVQQSLF